MGYGDSSWDGCWGRGGDVPATTPLAVKPTTPRTTGQARRVAAVAPRMMTGKGMEFVEFVEFVGFARTVGRARRRECGRMVRNLVLVEEFIVEVSVDLSVDFIVELMVELRGWWWL